MYNVEARGSGIYGHSIQHREGGFPGSMQAMYTSKICLYLYTTSLYLWMLCIHRKARALCMTGKYSAKLVKGPVPDFCECFFVWGLSLNSQPLYY